MEILQNPDELKIVANQAGGLHAGDLDNSQGENENDSKIILAKSTQQPFLCQGTDSFILIGCL